MSDNGNSLNDIFAGLSLFDDSSEDNMPEDNMMPEEPPEDEHDSPDDICDEEVQNDNDEPAYEDSSEESASIKMKACPYCWESIPDDPEMRTCPKCSEELFKKCPKCGGKIWYPEYICHNCGIDSSRVDKLPDLVDRMNDAFQANEVDEAEDYLKQINEIWPDYEAAQETAGKIESFKKAYAETGEQLQQLVSEKRFYEAGRLLRNNPQYSFRQEDEIENVLEQCKSIREEIASRPDNDFQDLIDKIKSICPDYDLDSIYNSTTLFAVDRLEFNNEMNGLRVSFPVSDTPGELEYEIFRSTDQPYETLRKWDDGFPKRMEEFTYNAEKETFSFLDKQIEYGHIYYYTVIVYRSGFDFHSAKYTDDDIADTTDMYPYLPEIDNSDFICKAEDQKIRITWNPLPKGVSVEITRKEGSRPLRPTDGKKLKVTEKNSLVDENLTNGKNYYYYIVYTYRSRGTDRASHPVIRNAVPKKLPKPVNDYRLKVIDEHQMENNYPDGYTAEQYRFFRLILGEEEPGTQTDYYCMTAGRVEIEGALEEKPVRDGEILSMKELKSFRGMEKLNQFNPSADSFEFPVRIGSCMIIFPVTFFRGSSENPQCVIGKVRLLKAEYRNQIISAEIYNDDMEIRLAEWPGKCHELFLLYSEGGYTDSSLIEDYEWENHQISSADYSCGDFAKIRNVRQQKYYISVFRKTIIEGESYYQEIAYKLVNNMPRTVITYKIEKRRKFFRSPEYYITFSADSKFTLEKTEIYIKKGIAPKYKADSTLTETLESKDGADRYEFKLNSEQFKPKFRIMPHFADEKFNKIYELIAESGSINQIE